MFFVCVFVEKSEPYLAVDVVLNVGTVSMCKTDAEFRNFVGAFVLQQLMQKHKIKLNIGLSMCSVAVEFFDYLAGVKFPKLRYGGGTRPVSALLFVLLFCSPRVIFFCLVAAAYSAACATSNG